MQPGGCRRLADDDLLVEESEDRSDEAMALCSRLNSRTDPGVVERSGGLLDERARIPTVRVPSSTRSPPVPEQQGHGTAVRTSTTGKKTA